MLTLEKLKKTIAEATKMKANKAPDFIVEIANGFFHEVNLPALQGFRDKTWRYPHGTILISFQSYDKLTKDPVFEMARANTDLASKSKNFIGFELRQASPQDCKRFLDEINEAIRKFSS